MARRRPRRARALVASTLIVSLAAVAAFVFGPTIAHRYGDALFSTSRCTVTIDGATSTLTAEQADNAALIAATAKRRGLPAHAVTVALATALQESDLRNVDYGDRDSVGLFQQRPSQGWGTVEQIRDPHFATNQFYDQLELVAGWETLPVTEAAQAVQRSGHPLGYADHEDDARLWARALTGEVPFGALACSPVGDGADDSSPASFVERASADFGATVTAVTVPGGDGETTVRLTSTDAAASGAPVDAVDAVGAWAVAVSWGWPVASVGTCEAVWDRAEGAVVTVAQAPPDCGGAVVVVFAPDPASAT